MDPKLIMTPSGLEHPRFGLPESTFPNGSGIPMVQVLDESGQVVGKVPELSAEDFRSLYEWMVRVRAFDTRMVSLQRQGRIAFFVPSTGEEAAQIGTAAAMQAIDWVFPAYREQGVLMYRGCPLEVLLCQMLGNRDDVMKGRQMPNHFGSPRYRFACASSPVGTQIPHAVGAAWSARLRREASVAVAYFGDGATSTGDFHAGMNFAATQQLPVVFCCKNNGWAISLPVAKQTRSETMAGKASAYGMPGLRVDGNDVLAVYSAAREALEWARSGSGPVLLELVTQRMGPHSTADDPNRYRDAELLDPWRKRDPIERFRRFLESRDLWTGEDEERSRSEADRELVDSLAEVEKIPAPALETMFEDVFAEIPWHLREQRDEAIAQARSEK